MTRLIETLDEIAGGYSAIFCDVWGVVHNGLSAFPRAVDALRRVREKGVVVVLVTNSPRPRDDVQQQLAAIGVSEDAWDRLVTSGDVTRDLIRSGPRRLFHIGP